MANKTRILLLMGHNILHMDYGSMINAASTQPVPRQLKRKFRKFKVYVGGGGDGGDFDGGYGFGAP